MTTPILTAKDLRKTYGDNEAVKGISFSVLRGEIFSLLGPNGAGKSTTINMLSCLIEPTGGTAEIAGHPIPGDTLNVRRAIGVVPQEIALYDALSARQNLEFWGRLYDMSGKELTRRIDEVLEQVGLSDRAKDKIKTFSGGMKRRINIAAGLLHKPQLLFMDEPTVGIDPQSRRRILDMVRELRDAGHDRPLHHSLYGRGRRTLRPRRHHRPGQAHRPGHASRADQSGGRAGDAAPAPG
jgi:ABC-2 type transport system ATP-binding protein